MKKITLEPNWKNLYKFIMALPEKDRKKFIKTMGKTEWDKLVAIADVKESKVVKKKKLDEGLSMLTKLLPQRVDNFKFKGLPGQFNEYGEKVFDEYGNPLNEKKDDPSGERKSLVAQIRNLVAQYGPAGYGVLTSQENKDVDKLIDKIEKTIV